MEIVAGRYEIEREIGRGGMGVVLLARDSTLGRRVALKKLTLDATGTGAEEATRRFMREARLTSQLAHPCIVNLFDVLEVGNELFIVLEYYESESLADRVTRTGPMREEEVRRLGTQVSSALAYAHSEGVVHRDVKPDNILLGEKGAKLTDFGIARLTEGNQDSDTKLTQTGFYVGTPGYMSPEQIQGDQASSASDVFSVALTLYFALCNDEPFGSGAPAAVLYRIVHEPLNFERLAISEDLRRALSAASAKDPADRPSAAELAGQLAGAVPAPDPSPAVEAAKASVVQAFEPQITATAPDAQAVPTAPPLATPPLTPIPAQPGHPSVMTPPPGPLTPHDPSPKPKRAGLIVALVTIVVVVVLGMAAVIGARGARRAASPTTYTSSQGYSTSTPPGWNARYNAGDRSDEFTSRDTRARVLIGKMGPERADIEEKDAENLLKEYVREVIPIGSGLKVDDGITKVNVDEDYNGNPGVMFNIVVIDEQTRSRFTAEYFIFNAGESQWAVLTAAPEGTYERYRPAFNEIENAFTTG